MDLIAKALLALHIAAGTAALVCGAAPIFAPKRQGFHTRWGRRFVTCMVTVLGSAIGLTVLALNPYFAALTTLATLGCFSGVRVLKRKRPDLRREDRARPLDWAVTLAAISVAALLGLLVATGDMRGNPTVVYALVGGAFVYGGWDLLRFAVPTGWPFFPRLWFYEHLVKMLGSYSAVVGAFSGSVAFRFLPDPWKQLWATIVFNILTLAMIAWYARQARRRAAAA
jgi:uncharacterized membrane protein